MTSQALAQAPLIFIPGIKGTELFDQQKKMQWLDGLEALSLRTPDIRLPLNFDQNGVQAQDTLTAGSPLEQVQVLFYGYPIYKSWLTSAKTMGHPFISFGYDWRRDNNESLKKFTALATKIFEENGHKKINIVGHSMGGMIAFAFAGQHPEMIENLFLVGSPLKGGIGFLPDLTVGTTTGLNKTITSPEVLSTFPSVYSFFPFESGGLVLTKELKPTNLDFYSAATWKKYQWGAYEHAEFLQTALDRAKLFRRRLQKQNVTYPKIYVISSQVHKTLKTAVLDEAHLRLDFKSQPEGLGDGRVLESDARPPEGVPYELFESNESHEHLLDDSKVQEFIRRTKIFSLR